MILRLCSVQEDPAELVNKYNYVRNNPVNFVDPWGWAIIRMRRVNNWYLRYFDRVFYGDDRKGKHWHIFYDDGTNSGYLGDDNRGMPLFGRDDSKQEYDGFIARNLNDFILKYAEQRVQQRWNELYRRGERRYEHPDNDCQIYIIEVMEEYIKINNEITDLINDYERKKDKEKAR